MVICMPDAYVFNVSADGAFSVGEVKRKRGMSIGFHFDIPLLNLLGYSITTSLRIGSS